MPNVPNRLERSRIAARASVDERTIKKYFVSPGKLRPIFVAQIRGALADLKISDPHPVSLGTSHP